MPPPEIPPVPVFILDAFSAWIVADVHRLYGRGMDLTPADRDYWRVRYDEEWRTEPATININGQPLSTADRDTRVRNRLIADYRMFGPWGRRPRPQPLVQSGPAEGT
jgi:hypothetical protein